MKKICVRIIKNINTGGNSSNNNNSNNNTGSGLHKIKS